MRSLRLWLVAATVALAMARPAMANVEDGVKKWRAGDYAGAVAQWRKPAEKGDADAQFNLGQAYKLGRGVTTDAATAIALYRKAAAQGHGAAEANLGWMLFQQGERGEAVPLLQKAAARGDAHSQYLLGVAYFNGDAVPVDRTRAYRLMSAAANAGLPQAKDTLISMDARMPLAERQRALAAEPAKPEAPVAPALETARTPAAAPSAPAQWRVQLGAFSSQAAAATAWTALAAKQKYLSPLTPFYEPAGRMIRLQAGPFADRKQASQICARIATDGASCFPVRP
mgnify:FL=1